MTSCSHSDENEVLQNTSKRCQSFSRQVKNSSKNNRSFAKVQQTAATTTVTGVTDEHPSNVEAQIPEDVRHVTPPKTPIINEQVRIL